tara:strand:- start:937 stop:1287 length:351 start_codon:yes stop_codon:yes gene_type:complete
MYIMKDIKVIQGSEHHQAIVNFIQENNVIVSSLDEMKEEVILKMIRAGYMFTGDRDRLRDAMEDITYFCSPEDDLNKDRVLRSLEYDDSEDDMDFQGGEECSTCVPEDVSSQEHST